MDGRTVLGQGESFKHWPYRQVGDETTNRASSGLLRRLFSDGGLTMHRARLYRHPTSLGIRQVLLIDLGRPFCEEPIFGRLRALWLVEERCRKVFLYGTEDAPNPRAIGGAVMGNLPVLDPDSTWLERVAKTTAMGILGLEAASMRGASSTTRKDAAVLAQVEGAVLRGALAAFIERLDTDVLAAVRAESSPCPETYNYYWNNNGTFRRNRTQAAVCFPLFSEPLRNDWRLRCSVDRGVPLVRELATRYQVSPRTIQHSRTVASALVSPDERVILLKRLDQLSAEQMPKTDQDWKQFVELSEGIFDLAAVLVVDIRRFAELFAKGWHHGCAVLSLKLGAEFDVAAIYEMMQATYRYGVYPTLQKEIAAAGRLATLSQDPPAGFFPLWFGHYALPRLAEMAGRWRLAYRQFSLQRMGFQDAGLGAKLTWPGLLGTGVGHSHGPYRVVELTSRQALELEGREQRHCVASYAVKCLLGDSALFSIRDRHNGKVLSTFEVGLTADVPVLLRHHGFGNECPAEELQIVAARFVEQVLTSLPTTRIAAARRECQSIGASVRGLLVAPNTHEKPLSEEEQAALAEAVAFAHPPEARREGLLTFFQRNGQDCGIAAPAGSALDIAPVH